MVLKVDVINAYKRVKQKIIKTPIIFSDYLSNRVGAKVFLKLENFQRTGSFKERGALNFLLAHNEKKPVVAASAGNHAQAVALHANLLNIPATIFMPLLTPKNKVYRTELLKATVRLVGNNYGEAYDAACHFCKENNFQFVNAYNDPYIIAGQGTVALEIDEEIEKPNIIFVPTGGGGLTAGIATYFQDRIKEIKIIGVLAKDYNHNTKSLADGIAIKSLGDLNKKICDKLEVDFVKVSDDEIQTAILYLLEQQKIVSEGAGAASVAALLNFDKNLLANKTIVLIISGGNIDTSLLNKISKRELIKSHRLCRFGVVIEDYPNSLVNLLALVQHLSANITDIFHDRSFFPTRFNEVLIIITVEVKDEHHENSLYDYIKKQKYNLIYNKYLEVISDT